jgi:glyceraldehyde 3-phosphate dehydrogenase
MARTRVAINGFGRIGRLALRRCLERPDLEVVAINDLCDNPTLTYLFRYDSVHGRYPGAVALVDDHLEVEGRRIPMTSIRDPKECKWGERGIDVLLECTGVFTKRDKIQLHLDAGAPRVLVSAPAKDPDLTVVLGVNHEDYDPAKHRIVSNASCTTNCVAPVLGFEVGHQELLALLLKALHEAFTVTAGVLNTVHAYTMGQSLLDGPEDDPRRCRAAALNLAPTTTGAAKAVGLVIPSLKGKLDGFAVRAPVPDGSMADLTLLLQREATVDEVHQVLRAYEERYPDVLQVTADPIVSSDMIGDRHSSVVDSALTMKVGPLLKLVAWYDNEGGYATRLVDVAQYLASR